MNAMLPIMLYAGAYLLLFVTWALVIFLKVPGADSLVQYIQITLGGLTGHVLTMIDPRRRDAATAPDVPTGAQAGFARPALLLLLCAVSMLLMTGCGALNTFTGAQLNAAESNYAGTRQNVKSLDDMKLIAWSDAACAMPVGALQRNATGNPYAVNAVLTACPIPNVGVIKAQDGNVSVQFTTPMPTQPYAPPAPQPPVTK